VSAGATPGCAVCGDERALVARQLGVCRRCLLERFDEAWPLVEALRTRSRARFGLPPGPPRHPGGVPCPLCAQACVIGAGERGFCGLRAGEAAAGRTRLAHLSGTSRHGILQWYRDQLPTNCVADWVCAACRRAGDHNLAVAYSSCTFDCLFCQNWHFREVDPRTAVATSADDLAAVANPRTFCVCFFGGDPASQMAHALTTGRRLAERGVKVCWETAGSARPELMDEAVELSLASSGTVKFDLKAYDERLHLALTGASNRRTLESFARAVARARARPEPPLVVASTLLVPGYVTPDEVGRIACFIASLDPTTPYALLAFAPRYLMTDLPRTSRRHAEEAEAAARAAGLTRVRIGNRLLLR
jgi:pyruvate formate lyase activating enzyme